ncbi:MAG: peptide MFS transporter [Bdellovibrionota bacterium]
MLNQPKGVLSLASTEMWERFSFYTIQTLLVLYAAASLTKGGLGWSEKDALYITGLYGAAVYATPALGGILADRYLGAKKAVAVGGILMCCGHFIMAIQSEFAFFVALILLCVGCGLLKPCISSMVGECYEEKDPRRESGFALFYMAINIGGFIGSFLAGNISNTYGYHYAFAMAGFGLIVGLVNFYIVCKKSLSHVGNNYAKNTIKIKKTVTPLTKLEKRRLLVYMAMCVANIVWSIVYGLPYGLLTLYAENNIDRTIFGFQIPSTWYYGMYGLFIVIFAPILGVFYNFLAKKNINFTLSNKLAIGYFTVALGCMALLPTVMKISHDPKAHVASTGLIIFYVIFALSELLTVPVLLSAATRLAPQRYVSRMVSFNIVVSWSLGAWISGVVSGWTINIGATSMFVTLIISCSTFGILHKIFDKKVESLCEEEVVAKKRLLVSV